jgi:phosphatidate cytidylyltransferase
MKTRAITAFFFTIVMLGSIFLGAYTFSAFYLLLSLVALLEFYKMVKIGGIRPHCNIGVMVAAAIYLTTAAYHFFQFELKYLLVIIPLIFSVFIAELYKKNKIPFANISYTFVGFIYITIPFCFFYSLGFLIDFNHYSYHFPLAFLLMLWANDTGAYLFGMKLGKRKLFERHSPKKSWEGFFGGVFTSLLVSALLSLQFKEVEPLVWAGMAVIISCFGTLGDLVESMLKRSLEVKDSGSFLPGHGGFLDRFDGLLIAAPIVYVYLYLLIY